MITRSKPLKVMVGFDGYLVDRSGTAAESGHAFLRAHLKEFLAARPTPADC